MNHLNDNELVLALDGEMEEAELKRAVDHLAGCDACRGRWEKLQGLSARVVEYSASLYGSTSSDDVRRLTLVESPKRFVIPVWSWGLVAAVVLIALAGIATLQSKHDANDSTATKSTARSFVAQSPHQRELAGTPTDAPQDDKLPLTGKVSTTGSVASPRAKHNAHKAEVSKPNEQNANQFTELPFSNAALPLDQATVVRVTLPASALRQAGVAVNEDNANAMLQADVVLGMDGLPRGIRLVTSGSSGTTN